MKKLAKDKYYQIAVLVLLDALLITAGGIAALLVRFDFSFAAIPQWCFGAWKQFLPLQILVIVAVFWLFRMYHFVWRNVSAQDVSHMVVSVVCAYAAFYILSLCLRIEQARSVRFIELLCALFLLVGVRCVLRIWSAVRGAYLQKHGSFHDRVMIIGAGECGRMLIREIMMSGRLNAQICCVIDDNKSKWGKYIAEIPIVGGRESIGYYAKKYGITEIIYAIPGADATQKKDILRLCSDTGCRVKAVPGIYQFVNEELKLSAVKDVQVEDLLGRESIKLRTDTVRAFLDGKTVLVTGGGGSIGSELCRQIARHDPKKLIIVDIYENNAYDIQQELRRTYGDKLDLQVVIASVRDKERMYSLFDKMRPDIVFHAAAHKHVPLMEDCPAEAIKNNVFGTYHVVRAAEKYGVKKFVMISTDKAVNPTNFMGATKRFCEMILQSKVDSPTEFCAVRFGNVLGSNGSVVPLFKRQIAEGGPVTITDKRIIRYFMTIPEASQLVLEAGAMAKQSQIFVLDMGEPVKILDLAENLIRLSGFEPYRDIEIREVGLRPGEKRYEELLMSSETLSKTENDKIFIEQQQRIDPAVIMRDLETLDRAVSSDIDNDELIAMMRGMIPTYHSPEEVNRRAEEKVGELAAV